MNSMSNNSINTNSDQVLFTTAVDKKTTVSLARTNNGEGVRLIVMKNNKEVDLATGNIKKVLEKTIQFLDAHPYAFGNEKDLKKYKALLEDIKNEHIDFKKKSNWLSKLIKFGVRDKSLAKINQAIENAYAFSNKQEKELNNALSSLESAIGKEAVEKLKKDPKFQDKKMQNTLIKASAAAQEITGANIYKKKSKELGDESYAFVINRKGDGVDITIKQNVIARGGFKKVNNALYLNKMKEVAVLSLKGQDREVLNFKWGPSTEFDKENDALMKLKDIPHIAPPYKFSTKRNLESEIEGANKIKYVMLQKKMDGDGTKIFNKSPAQQMRVMQHIATALSGMHEKGFVHLDVKLENMLIKGDLKDATEDIEGYLSDFGTMTTQGAYTNGTGEFMAPELKSRDQDRDGNTTGKVDSFSLGTSIFRLLYQKYDEKSEEYSGKFNDNEENLKRHLESLKDKIENSDSVSDEDREIQLKMLNVAAGLLEYDPNKRLSCEAAAKALA